MREKRRREGRRLSWRVYLLALVLNSMLGFLGQFAIFYPYFVVRDWLAGLGIGVAGIPFRDGYAAALLIGAALVAGYSVMMVAVNVAVLRRASVSQRLYWSFAVSVALVSSVVQLLWNTGSFHP